MLKITMKIDGMMCGMCESHVNDAVRRAFPVKKVTSSHTKGETVILTETDISEEQLRTAMDPTGYRVLSVRKENYEKKGLHDWFVGTKLYKKNLESFVQKKGMTVRTKVGIILPVTLLMGFGFFMMWRKGLAIPCVILAIVWACHMVYFLFGVKTIRGTKPDGTEISGERRKTA